MIRILNAEPLGYSNEAREMLNQLGKVVEAPLTRDDLIAHLPNYDVLIVRLGYEIDRQVIDAGSRLKVIVTPTTGLDHIDIGYANSKGIKVLSLQGETSFLCTVNATAEHTWALLLALLRRLPQAFASVQAGGWDRDDFHGTELDGKCLGILGLGRIGRKIAKYGLTFGMEVVAYDPYNRKREKKVVRLSKLSELLQCSHIVSLHIPLNSETRGIIGAEELALLPVGSVLINTSRGEIIDEKALIQALESNHLAGAAFDVVCHERNLEKRKMSPILSYAQTHDNLLITPHIGGATRESMSKTEIFMAHKLAAFINNQKKE